MRMVTMLTLASCLAAGLQAGNLKLRQRFELQGENPNDAFGFKCAWAGDINGDGHADFLVSAPGFANNAGKVYLYTLDAKGKAKLLWSAQGEAAVDGFGKSMGGCGDLNGDGKDDFYIAAPDYGQGLRSRGKLYVYYGKASGPGPQADWSEQGTQQDEVFGDCTSPLGDVNGDGYNDLIVGAYGRQQGRGAAWIYLGGPQGLKRQKGWQRLGKDAGDNLGYSHGAAGDVNGDGYDDALLGAKFASAGLVKNGQAWLFMGGPQGASKREAWTASGAEPNAIFANRIYGAGDVNGDGYADVMAGSPAAGSGRGAAFLYLGGPQGLSRSAAWAVSGTAAGDALGYVVAQIGDVNGDGFGDVMLGGPGSLSNPGLAKIYLGQAKGLALEAAWSGQGSEGKEGYGSWVAGLGQLWPGPQLAVAVGAPGWHGRRGRLVVAELLLGPGAKAGRPFRGPLSAGSRKRH